MDDICRICGHSSTFLFRGTLLDKHKVRYYACDLCGFVQTEKPFWLKEAYEQSINLTDTGLVRRNILGAKSVVTLLFFLFNRKGKFLDYAGGYGLFTRLMRNYGFDFYSHDPYTANLLAKGFDYNPNDRIELVTTFESFEHFEDPIAEIEKILAISKNIFFSTQLISNPAPSFGEWWYYGAEHGQHIAFYTGNTLKFIAEKYMLHIYSLKGYHLLTEKKINKWLFKFLIGAGRYGLYKIITPFMKSKVMSDMHTLKLHPSVDH
ncbi:methyltransferase family protein [Chitinophaga niastensis]|uniref:Methyltransferase family protein n=1 Tax=Chitinophaga niastensis TaxID=536980 RepID=A0A2P8HM75_CHINA|nr:class I SAM-dependent methyltransferase [Chitinophaga niastensis]PSL47318.1 methyltransferase family protein [Chitinophaga niastensis]